MTLTQRQALFISAEVMRIALKVSEVARLAGVSIRTLHHYDEIGLVRPSGRSAAGYRLYTQKDLEQLQQVLFFRELEFRWMRSSESSAIQISTWARRFGCNDSYSPSEPSASRL